MDANLYLTEACVHIAICRCRQQSCFETACWLYPLHLMKHLMAHMDVIIIFTMDSSRITTQTMTNNTHNYTLGFCCAENNVLQVEPSLQVPIGLCLSFLPLNQHLGSDIEICGVFSHILVAVSCQIIQARLPTTLQANWEKTIKQILNGRGW